MSSTTSCFTALSFNVLDTFWHLWLSNDTSYENVLQHMMLFCYTVVQCIQTSVIWLISLINTRLFFNMWCRHEIDQIGLFEYLSGWISHKLCQPKIYIRSWSSWSIIRLQSWSLWCDYAVMSQALQIYCSDNKTNMSSWSWYQIEQTVQARS
jgi:hypothetical protein